MSAHNIRAWPHDLLRYFTYDHLPPHLASISYQFARLATTIDHRLDPGAEKTVALRKLLEAKDAAVRSALDSLPWEAAPGEWVMGSAPLPEDGYPVITGWYREHVENGFYAQINCEDGDIRTVYAVTLEPAHD